MNDGGDDRLQELNRKLWSNQWLKHLVVPVVGMVVAGIILYLAFGRGSSSQTTAVVFPTADHLPEPTLPVATQVPETEAVTELWMRTLVSSSKSEGWEGDIDVAPGDTIHLYAAVHNHTSGAGATPCIAVRVPLLIEPGGAGLIEFTAATSLNAPSRAQDKVLVRSEEGVQLKYLPNTVRITTDLDGDGVKDEEVFVANGEDLFDDCFPLGHVVGHDAVIAQLGFTLRAVSLADR